MAAVMGEIAPVAKDKRNTQQNFNFRGIDDIYNAVNAVMAKHGVISVPKVIDVQTEERKFSSGTPQYIRRLTIEYWFYASDGSAVVATVIGEAGDSGDKASNKAMAAAHKYALLQALCIPTEEPKDPDADTSRDQAEAALDKPHMRYGNMIKAFDALGVTEAAVLKEAGKTTWKELTEQDYERLQSVYKDYQDGRRMA